MDTDKTKERYAVLTDTMMKMQTQDPKKRDKETHTDRDTENAQTYQKKLQRQTETDGQRGKKDKR